MTKKKSIFERFVWRIDSYFYNICYGGISYYTWKFFYPISNKGPKGSYLITFHFWLNVKLIKIYNFWDENIIPLLIEV